MLDSFLNNYPPTTATSASAGSIWADPAFLAFQRSLNGSLDAASASTALQGEAAQRALQMQLGSIQDQTKKGIDRTGVVAAGNGTWSSGARLQDQANIQTQGAGQQAAAQGNFYNRQQELQYDLADRVAEMRRQAAERGLKYAEQSYANQDLK